MIPHPTFFVHGTPAGQGNHRIARAGKFSRIYDANRNLAPWRESIAYSAVASGWTGREVLDCGVALSCVFVFCRPKSHFGKRGVKASAPALPHMTGDDHDKLLRAVCDALTGLVYRDDRRVVCCSTLKMWGDVDGVLVTVAPMLETPKRIVHEIRSVDVIGEPQIKLHAFAEHLRGSWPDGTFEDTWARAPKFDSTCRATA